MLPNRCRCGAVPRFNMDRVQTLSSQQRFGADGGDAEGDRHYRA